MKTLDLIKSLKSSELVAKKDKQKATAINYKIILDYVLKYKDVKFNGSTMNTDAKKEVIKDFMAGGYLSKDKQNTTKPAKSKIDRYAIIFTSTKIQDVVKNCDDVAKISKYFIALKIASQGKLLKFAGVKSKTALQSLKDSYNKLDDQDQDQAQEFVIWLNAQAKISGYSQTQAELDKIDQDNQKRA
jgi:ribosomal protein L10